MKPLRCFWRHNYCDYRNGRYTMCSACGKIKVFDDTKGLTKEDLSMESYK